MDRDGRVNPGTARRRSRPLVLVVQLVSMSQAGAGVVLRVAGLMRPARSMTLDADEEACPCPALAVIFCPYLSLSWRPGRAGRERSGKAERAKRAAPARRAGLKTYRKFSWIESSPASNVQDVLLTATDVGRKARNVRRAMKDEEMSNRLTREGAAMPVSSPNYPPGGFADNSLNAQATGEMTGRILEDNGALTTLAVRMTTSAVGSYVWEALAYLDVIEGNTRKIPALAQGIAQLSTAVQELTEEVNRLQSQVIALSVQIPFWTTEEGVLNGEWDDMGINKLPSASEAGLTVVITHESNPSTQPGHIISIDPPSGEFVGRGTVVRIVICQG